MKQATLAQKIERALRLGEIQVRVLGVALGSLVFLRWHAV